MFLMVSTFDSCKRWEELPPGGGDVDQGGESSHFTSECKVKYNKHHGLHHEGSPSRVPAERSPNTLDSVAFLGGGGRPTPIEVSPVVDTNKNGFNLLFLLIHFTSTSKVSKGVARIQSLGTLH